MDTCGLERVERFRINLNEKNFASQKNTLTSSAKMASRWHLRQRQRYACQFIPTSVLLRKGHRIRVALHWPEPTQACLSSLLARFSIPMFTARSRAVLNFSLPNGPDVHCRED
jgi:hypothetical protein